MRLSSLAQFLINACELKDRYGNILQLTEYQKKFLDDDSRLRLVIKSRQVGGSFMIAVESLLHALLRPGITILLVSRSLRQSTELLRKVKTIIKQFENKRLRLGNVVYVFRLVKDAETFLEFHNGSRIISLPNNPDTIRGFTAHLVYVDEAAMFSNDADIRQAVVFATTATGGRITLISTPKGRRGWFYEAYQSGKWSVHRIHYSQAPHISRQEIEEMRKALSDLDWRQEMELEFLDEAAALFPYELILSCIEDYEPSDSSDGAYIGVDFGRYRDSTVIAIVEKNSKIRLIFLDELKGVEFDRQVDYILKLINRFRARRVIVDKTGLGISVHDFLIQKNPIVEGFTFSQKSKIHLISTLYNVMKNKKLVFFENEELIKQLRQFQKIGDKYEAPAGQHDDYVIALALAVFASVSTPSGEAQARPLW
ncbi:MAG: terminase family protein [Nitrososphaerota archaeon]